jgi:hypothetical protein
MNPRHLWLVRTIRSCNNINKKETRMSNVSSTATVRLTSVIVAVVLLSAFAAPLLNVAARVIA